MTSFTSPTPAMVAWSLTKRTGVPNFFPCWLRISLITLAKVVWNKLQEIEVFGTEFLKNSFHTYESVLTNANLKERTKFFI